MSGRLNREVPIVPRIPVHRRLGLTLLEFLVAAAVVAVLFGLLLTAVGRARAVAQRMGCADNLRNQGLAVLGYESVYGRLPPGSVQGPCPPVGVTTDAEHGLWPFLLPYLGEDVLAGGYRFDVSYYDPANQPVAATPIEILECPAAPPNRMETAAQNAVWDYGGQGACTDYAPASVNPILADRGQIAPATDYGSALPVNGTVRLTDVTDGTSETILIVEDAGRPRALPGGAPGASVPGGPWASSANEITLQGSGGCAVDCTNDQAVYGLHPGGANVVFADGSVQFLTTAMNMQILGALLTRAGGEVIAAGDF